MGILKTMIGTNKDRFIWFGYDGFKKFCKKFNTTIVVVNMRTHAGCMGFISIKKQIERDEEIAEELQDGNKSDRGTESKDS